MKQYARIGVSWHYQSIRSGFLEDFAQNIALRVQAAVREMLPRRVHTRTNNIVSIRGAAGCVTLVGAGPGDPDLLTLKAIRAIERADVILFDALVSDAILKLARADAELVCVGKRGGRPSCRQDHINRSMAVFARSGKSVVRLKAGDPVIFGRAGEEISYLRMEGIEVAIVPGVTAASAMAAAFGISLTHRAHAKSVRFVTGHSKDGGLPEDIDWNAIADRSATTVFYMGGHTAREIANRLVDCGMSADTPVGIAASVSRPDEQIISCTLATLTLTVAVLDPAAPMIFGIGRAFAQVECLASLEAGAVRPDICV